MIKLDGSYGEGGGQIVRTALALSALTGQPFTVNNIRQGRKQPGLKAQHVTCITALEQLCKAKAEGGKLGSTTLTFIPGKIKAGTLNIDIGTAGSITLLMQSLLLPCMFAGKRTRLKIKGGTDTQWAMPIDYFTYVFVPHLRKFADIEVKLLKRGYYPKGQGEVEITIKPKHSIYDFETFETFKEAVTEATRPFDLLNQGKLMAIRGVSHAATTLKKNEVSERQAKAARHSLSYDCTMRIAKTYQDTASVGSGITLWALFSKDGTETDIFNPIVLGADALGEKGKSSEQVGEEAAAKLKEEIEAKAPVDEYAGDNLLPFLAFGGKIKVSKLSEHTKTNIYVIEQFLGKLFKVENTTISNLYK